MLSNNQGVRINVKCNTALAQNLINSKNKEINALENKYNSKINFIFDNHFSLHEPLIEKDVVLKVDNNVQENKSKKKKINNKKVNKKTNIVRKKKTSLKKVKDNKIEISKKIKIENKLKKEKNILNKSEEKTGWWS